MSELNGLALAILDLFYFLISILASIVTMIVLFILMLSYRKFSISTLCLYALSMLMFSIHNLTHAIMFIYRPIILISGRPLSILDSINTVSAFLGVLLLYIATEFSSNKEISYRSLLVFFMAGGALSAEFLGKDPFSNPLSITLETIGLILIVSIIFSTHMPLLKYVEDKGPRNMIYLFLVGIFLLMVSPITNVILSYLRAPSSLIDLWEIQFLMGILLLAYVLYKKPYIIIEAYSRPKLFVVMNKDGEILYRLLLDRNLTRTHIKEIEDFFRGIPILSKELMKSKASPKELKFSDFEIAITDRDNVASLLLAQKTSKTTIQLLKEITNRFCQDVYPLLKKEKLTEGEIERLQQFDLEIKKLITETTY